MKESDLFPYLKEYLETAGYTVRAEVNDCDIAATLGDEIIIIELKLRLNLELIIQATDRQRIIDSVYVAVPKPSGRAQKKRLKGVLHILRRLEVGLIFIEMDSKESVKIIFHPKQFQRRKQSRRKRALLKEISLRGKNRNVGGVTRRKIITAYRENVIQIAIYLKNLGETSAANLRKYGTGDKTSSILYSNFYKWFTRVDRGVYKLNERGAEEMMQWQDLVEHYETEFLKIEPTVE